MITPQIGQWWTTNKRGEGTAHRVGAVIPDLTVGASMLTYDFTRWIPLCQCITRGRDECGHFRARSEYPAVFSTYQPAATHSRCSSCEVMSPALDRWMEQQSSLRGVR